MNSGDTTSIQCTLSGGDLPVSINWLHNGKVLNSNENGISLSKISQRISVLSIESISAEHAGIYTCLARNQAGLSNYSTDLLVIGWLKLILYRIFLIFI